MRLLVLLALLGCGTSSPEPRAASPHAAPSRTGAGAPSANATAASAPCEGFARNRETHCGLTYADDLATCTAGSELAVMAGCAPGFLEAFSCMDKAVAACSDGACCKTAVEPCRAVFTTLDDCLAGYCKDHPDEPRCH